MARFFNFAGPCNPSEHYAVPATRRLESVRDLVGRHAYFVVHSPPRSGKTTSTLALASELTAEGRCISAVLSADAGKWPGPDVGTVETALLQQWRGNLGQQLAPELVPPPWPDSVPGTRIGAALGAWAKTSTKPLARFADDFDALPDAALQSLLRQGRSGHSFRPHGFPSSVGLVGMRAARDYRTHSGSPYNITQGTPELRPFTRDEVAALYAQHTADTGQRFLPGAIDRAFHWTQGQPWLVNRIASECVERLVPRRTDPVGAAHIDRAAEVVVEARETHIEDLAARLDEDRVRSVVEPMLMGEMTGADVPDDDVDYVLDLGILALRDRRLEVANPVCANAIARALTRAQERQIACDSQGCVRPDGRLDMAKLMTGFQQFWRKDGHLAAAGFRYTEAGPHLMLMAFLQRIVNGGGRVEREYALGRGALDLLVSWKDERFAVEVKLRRDRSTLPDAIEKTVRYLDFVGLPEGWLVLFDLRKTAWDRKIFNRKLRSGSKTVRVVGV